MRLRAGDLLYFSELVEAPTVEYGRRASVEAVRLLSPARLAEQRERILEILRASDGACAARVATYDIREFIY
jgi:hypothetical protein